MSTCEIYFRIGYNFPKSIFNIRPFTYCNMRLGIGLQLIPVMLKESTKLSSLTSNDLNGENSYNLHDNLSFDKNNKTCKVQNKHFVIHSLPKKFFLNLLLKLSTQKY